MKIRIIATFVFSMLVMGCMQPKPSHTPTQPDYFTHTVQYQGETLASIAKWYTGSANNWQTIRDANPGLNPNKIRMGTDIQIPRDLVVREAPFPKPQASTVQAKKGEVPAADQPSVDDGQGNTNQGDNYAAMGDNNGQPSYDDSQANTNQPTDEGSYSATDQNHQAGPADDFAMNDGQPSSDNGIPSTDQANPNNGQMPPDNGFGNDQPPANDGKSPVGSFLGALGKAVSDSKKEPEAN